MSDERYLKIIFEHFVAYLASRYNGGETLYIAELCDETLDRSGRLLGEVRNAARQRSKEQK
jgi:hypothetical protein